MSWRDLEVGQAEVVCPLCNEKVLLEDGMVIMPEHRTEESFPAATAKGMKLPRGVRVRCPASDAGLIYRE